jgi:hypothetical protein
MICCTRAGKSQWVPVTDATTHSEKLSKQLEKSGLEPEDISAEVNSRLQTLSYKKSRRKTSTKCGCKWSVRFTPPAPGDKNSVIRITSINVKHTNGCAPSQSTFRKHERRLGRVWSQALLIQGWFWALRLGFVFFVGFVGFGHKLYRYKVSVGQ